MNARAVNPHGYIPGTGLPVAPPVDRLRGPLTSQVTASGDKVRGTTTSGSATPKELRPVSRKRLEHYEETMPLRDFEVLERIANHRFLSTTQIRRFVFTDHASEEAAVVSARAVLRRLERRNLVRALDRRVGGFHAGSSAKIFQLAPAGARLLSRRGAGYRVQEPSTRFLRHCLAIADVHLVIRDLAEADPYERAEVETEPTCWRRFTGAGGERRWLQPDLAAVLTAPDFRDVWFVEVDLGSESLPALLRKCQRYEQYRATGLEQERQHAFPLVLWFMDDPRRAERLRTAIGHSSRLTPALYRITTPTGLREVLAGGGQ